MSSKQKNTHFKTAIKSLIAMFSHRKQVKNRIKRLTLTVAVLGHQSVGKTSMIKVLCGDEYDGHYIPTVLDVYEKETMLGSSLVKFEFIDIAGAYSFPAMRKLYIEKADIFFLVYDRTTDSVNEMLRLRTEIERIKGRHISELPVAVIKSKCDSTRSINDRNAIDEQISLWCGTLFHCSAKNGTNIAEIEDYLLSEGLFADTPPTSPLERNGAKRLSGRYIYGGRRRSKSLMLNRGADARSSPAL